MWCETLRLVGSAVMLSAILACGSLHTEESAQSKAVRDRSRVLGLALMDDGTYQFRLCRLHQDYTSEVLANECINPLVNEDGTARVFNSVPLKPGKALATFRNWATGFLVGSIIGGFLYTVGRFYVKIKGRDSIVGKVRLLEHKAKVNSAKGRNDFELVKQLGEIHTKGESAVFAGTDFTHAIAFAESYGKKVEGNIKKAKDAIETTRNQATTLSANRELAHTALQEARAALGQTDSGFNLSNNELAQDLLHNIDTVIKHTDELQTVNDKELPAKLQQMEEELKILYERAESKAGMRLQLSDKEKESLYAVAANTSDTTEAAKYIRTWKNNKAELGLLDGKYFANVIDFAKNNIKTAQSLIGKMRASGAEVTTEAEELQSLLSRVRTTLKRAESGFSPSDEYVHGILQEVDKLVKQASALQYAPTELSAKLQQMDTTVTAVIKRLQDKEELRPLLGNSEELEKVMTQLKYGKDGLVEKILRIDDVASPGSHDGKTIKAMRESIDAARREIKEANQAGNKVAENAAKEKLDKAKAELRQRIKSYNPSQQELIATAQENIAAKIKASETTTPAVRPSGGKGLGGKALGKLGDGVRDRLKFLHGFPWLGEDTLKYGRLRKITITDREEVVAKLADGGEVKTIEVQKGAEKLAAQVVGVSAFLSLPLTAWSRYLPGHALLSAERNWTAVTGGYATAKRIDDMQAILDGIAQATDSRVARQALTFGL